MDGAGLKELFRTLQDLKTDILQKTISKDDLKNVKKDLDSLRYSAKDKGMDTNLKEEVMLALG